jgi:hypothetical protein
LDGKDRRPEETTMAEQAGNDIQMDAANLYREET